MVLSPVLLLSLNNRPLHQLTLREEALLDLPLLQGDLFFLLNNASLFSKMISQAHLSLEREQNVHSAHRIYLTCEPFGKFPSIVANVSFFPFDPARIIPCDNSPRSLTGFKFVTQITFLPTKSSGV